MLNMDYMLIAERVVVGFDADGCAQLSNEEYVAIGAVTRPVSYGDYYRTTRDVTTPLYMSARTGVVVADVALYEASC